MTDESGTVNGNILYDQVLPPCGYTALELAQGDVIRVVDIEGQQVVGLLCLNRNRPEEKLSAPNTFGLNGQIYPRLGYCLYSDEAGRMMTITADTCGTHSMVAGACSSFTNELRYGVKDTPNCRDNFALALQPWGITWKDIPYPINLFMNVPVGTDGSYAIEFPKSKPGDLVELTADMDLLVAISNCPQERNKVNAFKLTPVRIIHYRPA